MYLIEGKNLIIKNGTINAPSRAIHIVDGDLTLNNVKINAVERCIGAYNDCNIIIDEDCVLTTTGNDVAIMMYSDKGRTEAITKLDLYGTVKSMNTQTGAWTISGNGNADHGKTEINIHEGAKVYCEGDSAIYHPQGGTLTIDGGTIEGKDGIYAKSGHIVVNGGTIKGNGNGEYVYSGNGTETPLGHGIVIEFTNYPSGLPRLDVNGGEITSTNKEGIGYYVSDKCPIQDLELLKSTYVNI